MLVKLIKLSFLTVSLTFEVAFAICPNVYAQQAITTQTQIVVPPGTIDGAKTPDQIPDVVAYRLFFVSVAVPPSATADKQERQRTYLARIGLGDPDLAALIAKLTDFYAQYADFRKRENDAADQTRAKGMPVDVRASVVRRDALVQSIRNELKSALTPAGMELLDAHVQREKQGMKILTIPNS